MKGTASGRLLTFPANKFPVELVERNLHCFTGNGETPRRVFSSDQWSDYLIFRLYPRLRVFFDGRSDFYGPWRGRMYQRLMAGESDSTAVLDHENVELALVPNNWPLSGILRSSPAWRVASADAQGVLFERTLIKSSAAADRCAE